MNDREMNHHGTERVHMIMAIRRKKDNPDVLTLSKENIIRMIEFDGSDFALETVRHRVKQYPGAWRIYRSINKRSVETARKLFMKELIDHPEKANNLESLWRTILMQPECKAEKRFLIDIDTKDPVVIEKVKELVKIGQSEWSIMNIKITETPNGFHIITNHFDTRKLIEYIIETNNDKIEIKRDAMEFIEAVIVDEPEKNQTT